MPQILAASNDLQEATTASYIHRRRDDLIETSSLQTSKTTSTVTNTNISNNNRHQNSTTTEGKLSSKTSSTSSSYPPNYRQSIQQQQQHRHNTSTSSHSSRCYPRRPSFTQHHAALDTSQESNNSSGAENQSGYSSECPSSSPTSPHVPAHTHERLPRLPPPPYRASQEFHQRNHKATEEISSPSSHNNHSSADDTVGSSSITHPHEQPPATFGGRRFFSCPLSMTALTKAAASSSDNWPLNDEIQRLASLPPQVFVHNPYHWDCLPPEEEEGQQWGCKSHEMKLEEEEEEEGEHYVFQPTNESVVDPIMEESFSSFHRQPFNRFHHPDLHFNYPSNGISMENEEPHRHPHHQHYYPPPPLPYDAVGDDNDIATLPNTPHLRPVPDGGADVPYLLPLPSPFSRDQTFFPQDYTELEEELEHELEWRRDIPMPRSCDFKRHQAGMGKRFALVKFQYRYRTYAFHASTFSEQPLDAGDVVIVPGDRGLDCGTVLKLQDTFFSRFPQQEWICRRASQREAMRLTEINRTASNALRYAKEIVQEQNINAELVGCDVQFDMKKITVHYKAPTVVIFESIVKALHRRYGCRIWLNHVNRDYALNSSYASSSCSPANSSHNTSYTSNYSTE